MCLKQSESEFFTGDTSNDIRYDVEEGQAVKNPD